MNRVEFEKEINMLSIQVEELQSKVEELSYEANRLWIEDETDNRKYYNAEYNLSDISGMLDDITLRLEDVFEDD